jgi:hypothetical protein
MVDIAAIAGLTSSLKATSDIVKAMVGLRDAEAFRMRAIELQNAVIDAQQKAMAAHQEHSALIERIRELEAECMSLKNWEAEKARYDLTNLGSGVIALRLKQAAMKPGEPMHCLCADCAENGKKLYLQPYAAGSHFIRYKCNGCGFDVTVSTSAVVRQQPYQPIID